MATRLMTVGAITLVALLWSPTPAFAICHGSVAYGSDGGAGDCGPAALWGALTIAASTVAAVVGWAVYSVAAFLNGPTFGKGFERPYDPNHRDYQYAGKHRTGRYYGRHRGWNPIDRLRLKYHQFVSAGSEMVQKGDERTEKYQVEKFGEVLDNKLFQGAGVVLEWGIRSAPAIRAGLAWLNNASLRVFMWWRHG